MSESQHDHLAAGFLPPTPTSLHSPAPSLPGATPSPANFITELPHPRSRALRPGSNKEDMVRDYASAKLMRVARRYVKKFSDPEPGDELTGYTRFEELCNDLDAVVNVLWLSGTPSLQTQILLRIASEFTEYAPSFPPDPVATLKLLRKLDHCFASLTTGRDLATREALPGFESGPSAGMTTTDVVRCRSTVENTRALMFNLLGDGATEVGSEDDDDSETDGPDEDGGTPAPRAAAGTINTDVDRIYENTLIVIGERLGGVL
ncbi:uncharacterized protein DNG_02351 [Cephalotrichum gorgonifer]|uniref:Meiotic recombination protein DMC1 n=1 Tax=Cephalotrichum gorgonifer TaxID=2041049 RepID=A0AAE8SSK7_9PEZI|nr:uncharacterized protein DNG_02351 [Cephalotrichum gorgonifer]